MSGPVFSLYHGGYAGGYRDLLCSSLSVPSTPAPVQWGRRLSSGLAPCLHLCTAQPLWLGVGGAVNRKSPARAHLIAMVPSCPCWSQSLLPPWRSPTGRPRPLRAWGTHPGSLMEWWGSYLGVREQMARRRVSGDLRIRTAGHKQSGLLTQILQCASVGGRGPCGSQRPQLLFFPE